MSGIHAAEPSLVLCPSDSDLRRIKELYERGLCLRAYEATRAFGDLTAWTSTEARVLAGRLAMNLGAGQLGARLHLRAYRHDPQSPLARYYFALNVCEFRGPLATWQLLERFGDMENASSSKRGDFCALRARAAARLRDFETAEAWLARAEQIAPGRAWHSVERASALIEEDRYHEALEAVRLALKQHFAPWYRPAVQQLAHLLQLLGRDDEAIQTLQEATAQIESGPVAVQLYTLLVERERFGEAAAALERYASLSPMLDDETRKWIEVQRVRIAYMQGDFEGAAEKADKVGDDFFTQMAARLRESKRAPRVRLNVQFVRQHHQTCAPATVAALGRFWKMPADHLSMAEAICYDGTPLHRQRTWAGENGWIVREFTATWEAARALLDRGVPFVLTTVETGSAHAQAVVGYDELRRTLLIRDPYQPLIAEVLAEPFLKRYAATGPRSMALVPRAEASRFDGIELADANLYDQLHLIEASLARHDRDTAAKALRGLEESHGDHRMVIEARRDIAFYDANQEELLQCAERLLEKFPDDGNLQLSKLSCLRDAPRQRRVDFLSSVCRDGKGDPGLWQAFAAEMSIDARDHPAALRYIRRSLRFRPIDAYSYSILADILWQQRRFDEALRLYRFAACVENKKENFARTYLSASRYLKQTDAALAFLADRFRRFGKQSALPCLTLFWAQCELDRVPDAFATLEQGLKLRPDDGDLARFAAEEFGRWGRNAEAAAALKRAEGKAPPAALLRTAASLAAFASDHAGALKLWRQVLDLEPLALDAQRAVTHLLAQTEGRAAALRHLEQVCAQRPHSCALHQLWIDWVRSEGATAVEPVVRRLLALNPSDTWARRELALALAEQRRFEEALAECAHALDLAPNDTWNFSARGYVHRLAGQLPNARSDWRKAIELSVDNTHAIEALVSSATSHAERLQALEFVQAELIKQVVLGDGLLTFYSVARNLLDPDQLLELLRLALRERPDLWHAHSAIILHLTNINRLDEALACARDATTRFPLLPRLWLDYARVCQARRDLPGERHALEKALQINSASSLAARALANLHQRLGDLPKARQILQQSLARDPLDPINHGTLAELLWQMGQKQEAIKAVEHAVNLAPGYDWAWNALRRWAGELDHPDLPARLARQLTEKRAGDALSWLRLGEMLGAPETLPESLKALDKAIELNPHCEAAYDLKAVLFTRERRFEEALAACQAEAWRGAPPMSLRGRAAWVEAERGRTIQAIEMIRAVLAEHPDYYWGWRELAEWHWRCGAMNDALEAAKALVRLAPLDPVPLGYMAGIKLQMKDRPGAKADFRRAMELDPNYTYAGYSLFDLLMEDGQLAAAGEALATIRLQVRDDWLIAREAQLAAREQNREQTLARVAELIASPQSDPWPLFTGVDAARNAGWSLQVRELLTSALEQRGNNPNVAAVWVDDRLRRRQLRCLKHLSRLTDQPEKMKRGLVRYVEGLAEHYSKAVTQRDIFVPTHCRRRLKQTLRRHGDLLRVEDELWGRVGYGLVAMALYEQTIAWLGDWRERKRVDPWMLFNLILAYQMRGNHQAVSECLRHAVHLPGSDAAVPGLRLYTALESVLDRDVTTAALMLKEIIRDRLRPDEAALCKVLDLLIPFVDGTTPKPRFGKLHREALGKFLDAHQKNRWMADAFTRSARLISDESGTKWPVIWAWLRRHGPLVIGVGLAVAVIGFNVFVTRS